MSGKSEMFTRKESVDADGRKRVTTIYKSSSVSHETHTSAGKPLVESLKDLDIHDHEEVPASEIEHRLHEGKWWETDDQPPWGDLLPHRAPVKRWRMSWSQTGPVKETSYSLDHECGGQTDVRVITDPKWETPVVVESYLGQQPPLGDAELEDMHKRFGAKIHAFAIKRRGSVIGDGECWTLANEALKHSGARVALGHNYGQEIERAKARKGDLIYFQHCRFEGSVPGGTYWKTIGDPEHVAIIDAIDGDKIKVIESNMDNVKEVSDGEYNLKDLQKGTVKFFRALPERKD